MYKKLLLSLALSIGLILTFAITSSAAAGDSWTAQSCGTSSNINGVCYSGSMFVAVGDGGTIVTSADGKSWTNQTSANSAITGNVNLKAVCYGNNIFMAVGDSGKVITSANGVTWTARAYAPNNLVSVYYGTGNTFVAVGNNPNLGGYIYTSTDGGVSWAEEYFYNGWFLNAVCYDGNQFIVVGDMDFSEKCKILTSTNGLDWNDYSSDQGDQALTCVCSDGNTCVAGDIQSRIMTSTDSAVTWVNRSWQDPSNCCFNGVCFGANIFAIVGSGGKIYTSADGATWNS
ncbi:MAG: hypothetical protein Q8876_08950, partial [Bacillota bacterium]|nr:hypothetical protein [Bacillota bacterium]